MPVTCVLAAVFLVASGRFIWALGHIRCACLLGGTKLVLPFFIVPHRKAKEA